MNMNPAPTQWALATERLPEPFKVVPCKYTPDSSDPRKDTELHWGFVSKEGNWSRGWQNHQVEWLDEAGATEYATKLHQARQEIEELKRWKEEAKQLLSPVWDFADKNLGVPLGECKVNAVMKCIEKTDKVLALYKQADKTNSDLIERAVTLLEKVKSRHEAGLLPDRFLYDEIKQFLDAK
jgi:hypothetical protein